MNVDKIIVLSEGCIVEEGNHEQLLQTGGYYLKLYNCYYECLGWIKKMPKNGKKLNIGIDFWDKMFYNKKELV